MGRGRSIVKPAAFGGVIGAGGIAGQGPDEGK